MSQGWIMDDLNGMVEPKEIGGGESPADSILETKPNRGTNTGRT